MPIPARVRPVLPFRPFQTKPRHTSSWLTQPRQSCLTSPCRARPVRAPSCHTLSASPHRATTDLSRTSLVGHSAPHPIAPYAPLHAIPELPRHARPGLAVPKQTLPLLPRLTVPRLASACPSMPFRVGLTYVLASSEMRFRSESSRDWMSSTSASIENAMANSRARRRYAAARPNSCTSASRARS